jgi:biopolymer transport protein ExbD
VYVVDKTPVTFEQLEDKLKAAVAKNPNVVMAINADEISPWGKIVKLRDAAADAKIKAIVAYTKEPPKH